MPNYQNAKIYKIVSENTDLCYIGSTTQSLKKRFECHKHHYKKHYYKNTSSFKILDFKCCKIVLIENYPCLTNRELCKRERYYIENFNCVNKQMPYRTKEEKIKTCKQWHVKNYLGKQLQCDICGRFVSIGTIATHKKSVICMTYIFSLLPFYIKPKKAYNKPYILKEVKKENKKEYDKEHRAKPYIIEQRTRKITCQICGSIIVERNLYRHVKTKKCLSNVK